MPVIRHLTGPNKIPLDPSREPSTGLANCALNLARIQAEMGNTVEILGYSPDGPREEIWQGVKLVAYNDWGRSKLRRWNLGWMLATSWMMRKRGVADIVHIHHWPEGVFLPYNQHRILHWHWIIPNLSSPFVRRAVSRADANLYPSRFLRDAFSEALDKALTRSYVVHNGADPDLFEAERGINFRGKWCAGANTKVVLFVGAITPEKGLYWLIKAVDLASKKTNVDVKLVVVGDARLWSKPKSGDRAAEYVSAVRDAAAKIDVVFTGPVARDQMPSVYRAADVVVVPSVVQEAHPTVVCEAMMAGKPVIASRVGGVPETIDDGKTGILVAAKDEHALAEAVLALVEDERRRTQMGQAGRKRAMELFTWERSARRVESVYRVAAQSTGRK